MEHSIFDLKLRKLLKDYFYFWDYTINQNEFLQKLGIIERANIISKKINFRAKADIFYRLKKLLHYNEMGNLFKVMFAKKKGKKFSLGFE